MSEDSNTIYVGSKHSMRYVLAVITHFNSSDVKKGTLKARGSAIANAIDILQIIRRKFLKDLKVDKIELGTQELQREDGKKRFKNRDQLEALNNLLVSTKDFNLIPSFLLFSFFCLKVRLVSGSSHLPFLTQSF